MITDHQQQRIRELLALRGLTFTPLQEEMIDHIGCDVEQQMEEGLSFEEALSKTLDEIPTEQFVVIQTETIEAINHRIAISRWLSYLSIAFLMGSALFKILHLQFGDVLILVAFSLIAASLVVSTVSGVLINKRKKGVLYVLSVIFGVVLMIIGYIFKILHLPGSDDLIVVSVALLVITIFFNTFFIYRHASGKNDLLTFLHEKYTPGIERFLLLLLAPMTLYKLMTIITHNDQFIGNLILLIVIFGGVLQLIALGWRSIQNGTAFQRPSLLIALLGSSTVVILVFLGTVIPFEIRVIMIIAYLASSAWFTFQIGESRSLISLVSVCFVPVLFLGWGLIELKLVDAGMRALVFNMPVLILLIAALIISKKESPLRTFLIISLSSYLFEYI